MILNIGKEELRSRQKSFFKSIKELGADVSILFSTTDIFYLTGFHFRPSERPIAFFTDMNNKTHLYVPRLEKEHAEEYAIIDFVHYYTEYPGTTHPMEILKDILLSWNFPKVSIGVDAKGYNSAKGYKGPEIKELLNTRSVVSLKGVVEKLRFVKSPDEIELIKESARWGNERHDAFSLYAMPTSVA